MNIIKPGSRVYEYRKQKLRASGQGKDISNGMSFKGGAATIISEADRKILNVFSQHYGNVGERLGQKVGKLVTTSDILKRNSRFILEEGVSSIKPKTIGKSLVENIIFPFTMLPLYGVSWVLKRVQSIPALAKGAKKIYNKPLLRIPRKLNELDSKTDMIKGIFDKTKSVITNYAKEKGIEPEKLIDMLNNADDTPEAKKVVKEANEYIKENLYKVSNKFFDKHTGNFNTAYERPLNRIVTGLIPVAFLANDAYNLSVLCGDKKEMSKKEANERRKQEISRVFTTAYIQLLTFGAFTKQVNTIPWFTPLTSALTVLFSETSSRKRLGKPIFFLSKDKAKEYNKRNEEKRIKDKNRTEKKQKTQVITDKDKSNNQVSIFNNEPSVFTSFKGEENKPITEVKKEEPKKALINFKTFKNGVALLITAGFTLSFLKNSSFTKNSSIIKGIKKVGEFCKNKIYNPLAFKDFTISRENFNQITKSLKDSGCKEIAQGHEFIKEKYAKEMSDGSIKIFKSSLPKENVKNIITSAIDKLKSNGVNLTESEIISISESINTAIKMETGNIAENKFTYVAQRAQEIIQNKQNNINGTQFEGFIEAITDAISKNVKSTPIQMETKLKPFVDIVTQPFKFIMSAAKLPFKLTSNIINIMVSPIEKKAAQAVLGKAELTKFEKGIHRVVTEIYGEKSPKTGKISQTIFVNAMEQLNKQTKPYRKAVETYERALNGGLSSQEIEKAKKAVEKAKKKLMIYVNTAVEKSFNGVTQSSNKNTDLAMMSKLASSAVTSAFLVADNYNMVMLKSNGEDVEGAKETANERIIQRLSALFYQTLFINWFNATFRATYNSSLKGMTAVAVPNTLTTEILTRKSIGMPIGRKTYEELQEIDEKNESRTGFTGKYFKFMRLLTGKKPLKDRLPKDKTNAATVNTSVINNVINSNTTNLIERYIKK